MLRPCDELIRLTEQVAAAWDDPRDPTFTQHAPLTMVRQRIYGILADYVDQNDHDTLRSDPVFKLIADRLPDDPDLASQPTVARFENAVSIPDLWRLPAAIDEPDRKRFFKRRRRRDPLGEGFAGTWRPRWIKVAAAVITRARRVIVRRSASGPHLHHLLAVSRAINAAAAAVPSG